MPDRRNKPPAFRAKRFESAPQMQAETGRLWYTIVMKGGEPMKVECQIGGEQEPHALLCIRKMTPAIEQAISLLEQEGESPPLTGEREGKTFFLDPEALELVCTEGGEIVCYDRQQNRYSLNRPLYELEKSLGGGFVRISKSTIVNIRRIDHVKAGFYGSMELVTKGGLEGSISRSYRKSFKERLGL